MFMDDYTLLSIKLVHAFFCIIFKIFPILFYILVSIYRHVFIMLYSSMIQCDVMIFGDCYYFHTTTYI